MARCVTAEMRLAHNPVYQLELARRQRRSAAAAAPLVVFAVNGAVLSFLMYRADDDLHAAMLLGCTAAAFACPLGVAAGVARSVASEFAEERLAALALTPVPAYDILRGKFHATARTAFAVIGCIVGTGLYAVTVALASGASVPFEVAAAIISLGFLGVAGCYFSGALAVLAATTTRSPSAMGVAAAAAGLAGLLWAWPALAGASVWGLLAAACVATALFLACTPGVFAVGVGLFSRALSGR